MKKTTIGMVLLCAILLGSCTKEAEMKNEALPQNTETTMDAFKPMTFEQTRALVGEVLGSDVAERIEPTSRYVRVFFPNVDRLLEEIRKEGLIYSSLPAPGIEITPVTVQEGRPEPVYTVLEGDAQLPTTWNTKCWRVLCTGRPAIGTDPRRSSYGRSGYEYDDTGSD